jgi:hypothetical protein
LDTSAQKFLLRIAEKAVKRRATCAGAPDIFENFIPSLKLLNAELKGLESPFLKQFGQNSAQPKWATGAFHSTFLTIAKSLRDELWHLKDMPDSCKDLTDCKVAINIPSMQGSFQLATKSCGADTVMPFFSLSWSGPLSDGMLEPCTVNSCTAGLKCMNVNDVARQIYKEMKPNSTSFGDLVTEGRIEEAFLAMGMIETAKELDQCEDPKGAWGYVNKFKTWVSKTLFRVSTVPVFTDDLSFCMLPIDKLKNIPEDFKEAINGGSVEDTVYSSTSTSSALDNLKKCHAKGCLFPGRNVGNGQCNRECNNPECGWDGGDCKCVDPTNCDSTKYAGDLKRAGDYDDTFLFRLKTITVPRGTKGIQDWNGKLQDGSQVDSPDRLHGVAFAAGAPEMGADAKGTTMIKHDCNGAGGFLLGGMPAMLNGMAAPQAEKLFGYMSSYFYTMSKCKQDVLKTQAVDTLAQWRNKIEVYSADMWLYYFDTASGKPAYGDDKGGKLGVKHWFGFARGDGIPKGAIEMPSSCSYSSYSSSGSCKIKYTGLSKLFSSQFDIIAEVKRCPAKPGEAWTAEQVPAFALSLEGKITKALQTPKMCSSDSDCMGSAKCMPIGAAVDGVLKGKMRDPVGYAVYGINPWTSQCSTATEMKKDIRRLLMEMGDQRFDDKSELKTCVMDYSAVTSRAQTWVKEIAPTGDKIIKVPFLESTTDSALNYGIPVVDPKKEIKFTLPKMSLRTFRVQRKKFKRSIANWINNNMKKWNIFKGEVSRDQIYITFPKESDFDASSRRLAAAGNLEVKFQVVTDEEYSVDASDKNSLAAQMTASNAEGGDDSFGAAAGDNGMTKEGGTSYSSADSKEIPAIEGGCGDSCGSTPWGLIGGVLAAVLVVGSIVGAAVGYKLGMFGRRVPSNAQKFNNEKTPQNTPVSSSNINVQMTVKAPQMATAIARPVTASPWQQHFDTSSGQPYWHNTQTNETTWNAP